MAAAIRGNDMLKGPQRARAPAHLDKEEALLWDEIVKTYALDDAASLELLSSALEGRMRARRCREQVKRDGQTVMDDHGTMKAHPLLQIERNAQSQFLSAMRLLRFDIGGERK
jgi:phage terminase small subunit